MTRILALAFALALTTSVASLAPEADREGKTPALYAASHACRHDQKLCYGVCIPKHRKCRWRLG